MRECSLFGITGKVMCEPKVESLSPLDKMVYEEETEAFEEALSHAGIAILHRFGLRGQARRTQQELAVELGCSHQAVAKKYKSDLKALRRKLEDITQ